MTSEEYVYKGYDNILDVPFTIWPEWIIECVKKIDSESNDEDAHVLEDALWLCVLRKIANGGTTDSVECAKAAITSIKIPIARWHA